jgi:dihydroneopterin aldolase
MKTPVSLISLVSLLLVFTSCKEDVKETLQKKVEVSLSLETGDDPAPLNDTIDFSADYRMYLTSFKAYLSNITLIAADGTETLLEDVALFSLHKEESSRISMDLPQGNFTKIRVGVGLNPEQNNSDPNSFSNNNHPLAAYQGMYWTMTKYRFVVFEGFALSKRDTTIIPFAYHTGTDPVYQEITFDTDINSTGSPLAYRLHFDIDINTIFDGPAGKIDIPTQSFTHSEGPNLAVAVTFMENLKSAIHLQTSASLD